MIGQLNIHETLGGEIQGKFQTGAGKRLGEPREALIEDLRGQGIDEPAFSAMGIKRSGMTNPLSGWFHRTSASSPAVAPLLHSIFG